MSSHESGNRKSVVSGSDTALLRLRSLTIGDVFVNTNSTWVNPLREQLQLLKKRKQLEVFVLPNNMPCTSNY